MVQKYSWKNRGFPNEVGSIGEKVAKKWLEEKGYRVYYFQDIMGEFADLHLIESRMAKRRKAEFKEIDKQRIYEIENLFRAIFGQKYDTFKRFDEVIRKLARKEEETRQKQGLRKRRPVGFDYIANKDGNFFLIDVKVNQAEIKKYQKLSSCITKECGFKVMVLRLNVEIEIGQNIQLIECKHFYGEVNG